MRDEGRKDGAFPALYPDVTEIEEDSHCLRNYPDLLRTLYCRTSQPGCRELSESSIMRDPEDIQSSCS